MVLKNSLFVFFLFLSSLLSAQDKQIVTVNLVNGSSVTGTLIENVPNEYLIIDIGTEEPLRIPYENLYLISYSKSRKKQDPREEYLGWFLQADLGAIFAKEFSGDDISFEPSMHLAGGRSVIPKLRSGLGLGFDFFDGITFVPIYALADYDILKGSKSPYINARVGYGLGLKNNSGYYDEIVSVEGGFYYSIGAGYKVQYKKSRLYITLRYVFQRSVLEVNDMFIEGREERNNRNIGLSVSYLFGF